MKQIFLITIIMLSMSLSFAQSSWWGVSSDGSFYRFLIANNGKSIVVNFATDDTGRYWREVENESGYYYIINLKSGLYVQPERKKPKKGGKLILAAPNGSDIQQWKKIPAGNYEYHYLPKLNNKLYVSVSDKSVTLQPFGKKYGQTSVIGAAACPFVYIKQKNNYSNIGEIIKNQISPSADKYDELEIPFDMIENNKFTVKISEEKDEISYIDHIYLQIEDQIISPVGNAAVFTNISKADGKYLKLHKGETFELNFNLPDNLSKNSKIKIVAKGYYIPVNVNQK